MQTLTTQEKIEAIRQSAHELHASVNQHYDKDLPYAVHLDAVAGAAERFCDNVLADEADRLPLMFGAFYHDSIEDARMTYNDVMAVARQYMNDEQALTATEIVYALTNDKGRTRAERAGERYYEGIRTTPYAPFVKLCDRLANATYSHDQAAKNPVNGHMKEVYAKELPHFLEAIDPHRDDDKRFALPTTMVDELRALMA